MKQKFEIFENPELLKEIPKETGVYIIYSKDDEILYVGKAKSLRDRLRSYITASGVDFFKQSLLKEAYSVEIIILKSELEALLLESNLIKQYRPPYNVVLRDDKSYPYLRISYTEKFPRISIARRVKNKGDFYFGPITPVERLKSLVELLKTTFKIAQKNDKQCQGSKTACIYYQMNRCMAPCIGNVSKEEYLKAINEIKSILTNPSSIKQKLKVELKEAIDKLEFEKAIKIRDKLKAIEILESKQTVSEVGEDFLDAIAFTEKDGIVCAYIMSVRFKNIVGNRNFIFYGNEITGDFVESFLIQYYIRLNQVIPDVVVTEKIKSTEPISRALSETKRVEVLVPKKGEKKRLLELAKKNAEITLKLHLDRFKKDIEIFKKLEEQLELTKMPITIDVADISHISFENVVGGVIRYTLGGFDKGLYRRFNLTHKYESEAMKEMLSRHKKLLIRSSNKLADLIIVDGGPIQIKAAKEVLGEEYDVIGIAKEKREERTIRSKGEAIDSIYKNSNKVEVDQEVLEFIQKLRDEAHRFAIEFHRKKRKDYVLSSALDRIEFIGPKRKKALFEKFGNIDNLKKASIEDIASVKGISKKIATIIKEKLADLD